MRRIFLALFSLLLVFSHSTQDYIRSQDITLTDDIRVGAEVANLNTIINKQAVLPPNNSLFKIVEDTKLVDYLNLECSSDEKCIIVLKKKLNYEDICEQFNTATNKSVQQPSACAQTLKIIAINQNDFIEIPVEIKHVKQTKKITFDFPTNLGLNLTSQFNTFFVNSATIIENSELNGNIEYNADSTSLPNYLQINLIKLGNGKLRLDVNFSSEQYLMRAYEQGSIYNIKINAFLPTSLFEFAENVAMLDLTLKMGEIERKKLQPLEFEYPIYTILLDGNLNQHHIVLEPKLKEISEENQVVYILLKDGDKNAPISSLDQTTSSLPFYVDTHDGSIHLKVSTMELFNVENEEKTFTFGLKATYKQLIDKKSSDNFKVNYYNDYIIPGFARIEIKLRRDSSSSRYKNKFKQIPKVESEFLTPFVSRYEILNEETANQTLVFYINDPIQIKSKLIKFYLRFNETNGTKLTWLLEEDIEKKNSFLYSVNGGNVTLINKNEFKDQFNYKTQLRLVEVIDTEERYEILSELNVEFRIDYDPILFEKADYSVYLTQANLIEQNLVNIRVRERLNKNFTNNVVYRIKENEMDYEFFEINPANGWLRARQVLIDKSFYEIVIVATNNDLQKTGVVKCKIYLDCTTTPKTSGLTPSTSIAKYNLFDKSSNRTQIGMFKSVCSVTRIDRQSYVYTTEAGDIFIKFCSKQNRLFCKKFNFNRLIEQQTNTDLKLIELISLDEFNGYLITNFMLNVNLLVSLINDEFFQMHDESKDVFDTHLVNLVFKANLKTESASLNYLMDVSINNVPKIVNFNEGLVVLEKSAGEEHESSERSSNGDGLNQCLFNYKFLINEEDSSSSTGGNKNTNNRNIAGLVSRNNIAKFQSSISSVPRFVKIDQNLGHHSEAEFKISDCSAWFFIYNNGCLAMRSDHLERNERCALLQSKSNVLLQAGAYSIVFKLCYYNNNKVSCSQFYNQSIVVPKDLKKSSRLETRTHKFTKLELDENETKGSDVNFNSADKISNKQPPGKGSALFRTTNYTIYLLVLFGVIIFIALMAMSMLFIMFFRPKRTSSSDKAFVLPKSSATSSSSSSSAASKSASDIYKRSILEVSCETTNRNSNGSSATHTPETSSNAPTTSSKISKLDEEDIVKIQVTDDYLSSSKTQQAQKAQQELLDTSKLRFQPNITNSENFNYAGSFSSIGESTHSYQSNVSNTENPKTSLNENEQGLYSVKNASIQYSTVNTSQINDLPRNISPIEYKQQQHMYDQQDAYFKASLIDVANNNGSSMQQSTPTGSSTNQDNSYLELSNGMQSFNNNTNARLSQQPKMNSLKQLKKDLALKKAVTQAANSLSNMNSNNHLHLYSSHNDNKINNYNNTSFIGGGGGVGYNKSNLVNENNSNNNSNIYNEAAFQYLSNKSNTNEVLLNPNEVIASVV